jgi:hypothetical protein
MKKRHAALVSAGILAAVAMPLLAATPASGMTPKDVSEFGVTGYGSLDPNSAGGSVVIDHNGTEHVVSIHETSSSDHVVYKTRAASASTWTSYAGGLVNYFGNSDASIHTLLTGDGKSIEVFIGSCDGLYETQVGITATKLPALHELGNLGNCSDDDGYATFTGAATLPHHRAITLTDSKHGVTYARTGTPGGHFSKSTPLTLPDAAPGTFDTRGITTDAATGRCWLLVSVDSDPTLTSGLYLWASQGNSSWSSPHKIPASAIGSHVGSFSHLEGFTVYGGRIALASTVLTQTPSSLRTVLDVAQRSASGTWSAATRVPHSSDESGTAMLAVNPASGHLHATWSQGGGDCTGACIGLRTEVFIGGQWSRFKALTNSIYDEPTSVTFNSHGKEITGYMRIT